MPAIGVRVSTILMTGAISILLFSHCKITREEKVNTIFSNYQGNVPGASVMVIQGGQPILIRSYGMADLENNIPVEPSTNFRLASVTKQFTAMCIMMLCERNKLSYNTGISEIFPGFPEYGDSISVRDLLHHTSGLIDYEDLIPDTATIQVLDKDVLKMMSGQDSTYFIPGSDYRYSNSGYAVLAMIIEKISGISFAEFLKQNIFDPLNMNNTVAFEQGISTVPHRAFGYTVDGDSILFTDQSLTSAVLGDGGIYSSVIDLFKWDQALYGDSLVSVETLQKAFSPYMETYGFGWRIDEYKGHRRMHHNGSTSGFRNTIQRYPDDEFTVIILTNRNEPDVAPLAEKLTDLYLTGE